ncbi:hypothetical protein [Pseudomonas arsenicoxydans]|uniref:hypothetical protein n=1 Tax=Pseudomonas arsenicoxydans TaxID=702115 RepID=UPI001375870A|nr:hypothetical protein [Pseudomonas arsenicoxydans]
MNHLITQMFTYLNNMDDVFSYKPIGIVSHISLPINHEEPEGMPLFSKKTKGVPQ